MGEDISAGWYADPVGGGGWRWWDGGRWTEVTREATASAQASGGTQQTDAGPGVSPRPAHTDDDVPPGGGRRRSAIVASGVLMSVLLMGVGAGLGAWLTGSFEPTSEPDAPEKEAGDAEAADSAESEKAAEAADAAGGETAADPTVGRNWSWIADDDAVFGGPSDQYMVSVVAGGRGLVAVGADVDQQAAAVWTSPDGENWARVDHDEDAFGGSGHQGMLSVIEGGPGLVAVGRDEGTGAAAVWTSPDGENWARVDHDEDAFGGSGRQVMWSVAEGGPGLVAVGIDEGKGAAAVWTSPDGRTWSRVAHDGTVFGGGSLQSMSAVTEGGPGLVAVGTDAAAGAGVWTSPDGRTWSRVPHDDEVFGDSSISGVAKGGLGLIAVGNDSDKDAAAVWTSPDGQTWSRVAHDETVFGGSGKQGMVSVVEGGPGLVAVGRDEGTGTAAVWTSPDGENWSRVARDQAVFGGPDKKLMNSVAVGEPGLVAVGIERDPQADAAVWVSE